MDRTADRTVDRTVRGNSRRILVADDDPGCLRLLTKLLQADGYEVLAVQDGSTARSALRENEIDLVLLDVTMPGEDGVSLCEHIKTAKSTRWTPVMLMTGMNSPTDRLRGIEMGADEFLAKPFPLDELRARVRALLRAKDELGEMEEAEAVIFSLALSIEATDPSTEGHCARLSDYAVALGSRLGLPREQIVALRRGGILHDIGKIGVPDHILRKEGPLTPAEREVMMRHPVVGEKICLPLRFLRDVLPIIRHHHEKMDGSGYPDRLRGEEIPLSARIMATVDVYDALSTDRVYRKAMTPEAALKTMWQEVKLGWWDPLLVEEFIHVLV
jgi:putative two-component system response regulator